MDEPLSKSGDGIFDTTPKNDWQMNIAYRNTLESPILRLSRELRDEIWKLCLPLTIKVSRKLPRQTNSTPSILLVSRQIYAEAATMDCNNFLTWSFSCRERYEDWYWEVLHKRNKVQRLQLCVDSFDLYAMAQVEDPGYGSDDEDEDVSSSGPRLQAFENLGELELWISRTYYDDDSEWEDESVEMPTGPPTSKIEKADEDSIKYSIENFTNTMRDKHQRVKVVCRVFPDTRTLKKRWSEHY